MHNLSISMGTRTCLDWRNFESAQELSRHCWGYVVVVHGISGGANRTRIVLRAAATAALGADTVHKAGVEEAAVEEAAHGLQEGGRIQHFSRDGRASNAAVVASVANRLGRMRVKNRSCHRGRSIVKATILCTSIAKAMKCPLGGVLFTIVIITIKSGKPMPLL